MSAPDDERAPNEDEFTEAIEKWARRAVARAPKRVPKGALAQIGAVYAEAIRRAASAMHKRAG